MVNLRAVKLAPFTAIEANGAFRLEITSGKDYSVTAKMPQSIKSEFQPKVADGRLNITIKDEHQTSNSSDIPVVTVRLPTLAGVDLSGQISAVFDGPLADKVTLTLTGQASLSTNALNGQSISVVMSGQSDLKANTVSGTGFYLVMNGQSSASLTTVMATDVSITCTGQSDVKGTSLTCTSGKVSTDGQSSVHFRLSSGAIRTHNRAQSSISL